MSLLPLLSFLSLLVSDSNISVIFLPHYLYIVSQTLKMLNMYVKCDKMTSMIRLSDATIQRLKEIKGEKLKEGETGRVSYDDIVNELLDSYEG